MTYAVKNGSALQPLIVHLGCYLHVLIKECGNIYFLYAAIRFQYLYKKTY